VKPAPSGYAYYFLAKQCGNCLGINRMEERRCHHCNNLFYCKVDDKQEVDVIFEKFNVKQNKMLTPEEQKEMKNG